MPPNDHGKTERLATRRLEALELRKAGASYRAIGQRLQISRQQALNDVRFELHELARKRERTTELLRQMELERSDALTLAVWPKVREGHLGAISTVLRVMEHRAKLLGLYAPQQVEMAAIVGITDAGEIQQRVASKLAAFVASVPEVIEITASPPEEPHGGNGHGRLLTPSSTG